MKISYLAVFLLLLRIHVLLADYTYKSCPFFPVQNRKHCRSNKDCPMGQSCCRYLLNKRLCTPSDAKACYVNGRRVAYGHSYLTPDQCHVCHCFGYNAFQCRMTCRVQNFLK